MRTTLILSRFMSNVDTSADCWTWTGAKNGSGYGAFQDGSPKGIGAHRWSYAEFNGAPGEVVRHSCGNRSCVKPTHLLSGTQSQNMQDKFTDRTGNTQKLSPEDVQEIRDRFVRYGQRRSNAHELAAEFGVGHKYVAMIAEGKRLSYVR